MRETTCRAVALARARFMVLHTVVVDIARHLTGMDSTERCDADDAGRSRRHVAALAAHVSRGVRPGRSVVRGWGCATMMIMLIMR